MGRGPRRGCVRHPHLGGGGGEGFCRIAVGAYVAPGAQAVHAVPDVGGGGQTRPGETRPGGHPHQRPARTVVGVGRGEFHLVVVRSMHRLPTHVHRAGLLARPRAQLGRCGQWPDGVRLLAQLEACAQDLRSIASGGLRNIHGQAHDELVQFRLGQVAEEDLRVVATGGLHDGPLQLLAPCQHLRECRVRRREVGVARQLRLQQQRLGHLVGGSESG